MKRSSSPSHGKIFAARLISNLTSYRDSKLKKARTRMLTQAQLTKEKKQIFKKYAQYPSFSFQGLRSAVRRYDSNLFTSSLADDLQIIPDLFNGPDEFKTMTAA